VLPGRAYSPSAPLLELARQALLQHGYAVQQVWWDAGSRPADVEPQVWVADQAAAALAAEAVPPRRVVVVGKSLGTWATSYAAGRGFEAIWLTPLLVEPTLVAGIRSNPARQLLVGGSADEFWDAGVAAGLVREGCDVMEIPNADHGLCVPGDVVRSAEAHVEVARGLAAFLGAAR
jgi:hypothetical protein